MATGRRRAQKDETSGMRTSPRAEARQVQCLGAQNGSKSGVQSDGIARISSNLGSALGVLAADWARLELEESAFNWIATCCLCSSV